jgi:hypothetical protein
MASCTVFLATMTVGLSLVLACNGSVRGETYMHDAAVDVARHDNGDAQDAPRVDVTRHDDGDAQTEAGSVVDGGDAADACPSGVPCECACPTGGDGGVCVCETFSMPACDMTIDRTPCTANTGCMGCFEGSGFECACVDDAGATIADGGGVWQCIGTEYPCTGGTP